MLQQQQNKTDTTAQTQNVLPVNQQTPQPQNKPVLSVVAAVAAAAAPSNESPQKLTPKSPAPQQKVDTVATSEISTAATEETPADTCIYPKLKNSQSSIEALLLNESFATYLNKGAYKLFQSKNIFTIGQLCSTTSTEMLSLPFKAPKMENFLNFIHKFLDQEQSVLSKISACITPPAYMGSVEEEMEKLEATNCFDTSIECEKDSEVVAALANKEPVDSAKKPPTESAESVQNCSAMSVEMESQSNEENAAEEEDPVKKQMDKDFENMESDLCEKVTALVRLKKAIHYATKEDQLKDLKRKHDELALQLRMRFY